MRSDMTREIQNKKFDAWRHGLLDISRRNRLMNYRRTKRTTLQIVSPSLRELYQRLVVDGERLSFRRQIDAGDDLRLRQLFYLMEKMDAPVELAEGEARSDVSSAEMNQTLRNLRAKARLSQEEQGINILYLSFGFMEWRQKPSDPLMRSPLVLVPVALEVDSILSPYRMQRLDEDIVVNPTLDYALTSEYGVALPDFDPLGDDIEAYLGAVNEAVGKNGWSVVPEVSLGLLSFLKIVMYKDLEKYRERIFANPVVRAFCGDVDALPPVDDALRDFPHDRIPASEICQVVNADASQQDAILLSRRGVSFVLQGPPGTGKSQTITNIIAQALADRKKVLFVSEKMAALSVVYRRLAEAGLADYCLSLHNYRAERRAVLQDLVRTLDAPARSVRPGVTDALNALEEERAALNAYVEEMEKPRLPLNRTFFQVVTELTGLEAEGFFRVTEDTQQVTDGDYAARLSALKRLSDFLVQYPGDIHDNPWRNTSLTMVGYDVRETVANRLDALAASLFGLSSSLSYLGQKYGTDRAWSLNDFDGLLEHALTRTALADARSGLGEPLFSEAVLAEAEEKRQRLAAARVDALTAGIPYAALADDASLEAVRDALNQERAGLERAAALTRAIRDATGVNLPDNGAGLIQGKALLEALNIPHAALPAWFGGGLEAAKAAVSGWKELADRAEALRRRIDADWEGGFYDLDYNGLLRRFLGDYTSFFKRLGGQYRKDRAALLSVRRGRPSRLDDGECASALQLLKDYARAAEQFQSAGRSAMELMGPRYQGLDTDWGAMLRTLEACEPANAYFKRYGLSDAVLGRLTKPREERERELLPGLGATSLENAIAACGDGQDAATEAERAYDERIGAVERRLAALDRLRAAAADGAEAYALYAVEGMKPPRDIDQMLSDLNALAGLAGQTLARAAAAKDFFRAVGLPDNREALSEITALYEEHYSQDAVNTAGEKLRAAYLARDEAAFADALAAIKDSRLPFAQAEPLAAFASWFQGEDFFSMPIDALSGFVSRCRDLESLQSWLNYAALRDACASQGLGEFLEFAESGGVTSDRLIPLYQKSFLTKWLIDALVLENVPGLQNFQSYAHEKTIEAFRLHDKQQLQIARARLEAQLSHEKPSGVTQLASAMDEVTLLRREAEKKRCILPLRRLFKQIPTVLQKLKPCFMMSPLSVSYFLDSDMYDFDLVIFDEASQILPEDAIGAIYRGRQVVIAGDTRQMPPTNFFAAAARNADDYDVDEDSDDYYPDVVSESVLDEAAACLPSCTLLWHYRSRDESLIAFSNRQLYDNRLVTFPNCSRLPDRGLEYVYVPDGYYEGSGRNCNVPEARRCLELVIEHIERHPERSLGIIAFSEKQQAVIEEVINDFRLNNRQYEDFFDESRDEPFFVKNLENVQGDERDTILFSICYARNAQGRMYQRFGPLGHDGGERRLNVAITRAKYNVKLVGSILPGDIVVREGVKDGVRMLRDYIYYAMQNDAGVPQGGAEVMDAPFADEIAAFLSANGYALRRGVGASRYKVDIAVEKPGAPDTLMAGIECDGADYAAVRTARDRDVLRRDLMAALGWKLYHVWSMAWYLNPEDEKRRLLEFLRRCADDRPDAPFADAEWVREPDGGERLTEAEEISDLPRTVAFEPYETADPWEAQYPQDADNYDILAERIRYVMAREQPMHREELYRRLAPVFGSAKVTAPVRRTIDDCMERRLSGFLTASGDFLYVSGTPVVARAPREGEEPRSIDHIAPEELEDAMRRILRVAYGLTARDLIGETARQLGYARTGPRINAVLEEIWRGMVASGGLREADGKLYCVEEMEET